MPATKRWTTRLCALALLTAVFAAAAPGQARAQPGPTFSDTAGHWALPAITGATGAGWVHGYPDGSFHPDSAVTRAEFVALLLGGQGLTPSSSVAMELVQSADWSGEIFAGYKQPFDPGEGLVAKYLTQPPLADVAGHWLQRIGWLDTAQRLGLVVPSDYTNGHSFILYYPTPEGPPRVVKDVAPANFAPDMPLTRQEATVLVARSLGLVYAAEHGPTAPLAFTDAAKVPGWAQGYVSAVAGSGVIKGYPDKTFRPDNPISRAEAVSIVQRTLDAMGTTSPDVQVFLHVPVPTPHDVPVTLAHPVQVIGNVAWVPARAALDASLQTNGVNGAAWTWQPITQALGLRVGNQTWATFEAGLRKAVYGNGEVYGSAPARLVRGVLYVTADAFLGGGTYDATTRKVTLPIFTGPPPPPNPS